MIRLYLFQPPADGLMKQLDLNELPSFVFVWSKILDSALFLFSQVQPRKKYAFLKAATASSSSIFDANAHCFKFNPKCTINFN